MIKRIGKKQFVGMLVFLLIGVAIGVLATKGESSVSAKPSDNPIYLDGVKTSITTYNIDGNNFVQLSDVVAAMDVNMEYDGNSNITYIDTNEEFSVDSEYAIRQERSSTYDIYNIVKYNAVWEKVATKEGSIFIEGVNFDSNNRLWFIDVAAHAIYYVDDKGEVITQYQNADTKTGIMPNGARFIDDTHLLITDRYQGLIIFDLTTNTFKTLFTGFEGQKFMGLNDLVLDGKGGCYFTDPGSASYYTTATGSVYYTNYSAEKPSLERISTGIAYPNGIALNPTGRFLYVAEFGTNQVLSIPTKEYKGPEGVRVFARLEGGIGPDGIECDSEGNVYCAHLEAGQVVVLDSKGFEICKIGLPESAGMKSDNLAIHNGYMYVCEADQGTIWRIAVNTSPIKH